MELSTAIPTAGRNKGPLTWTARPLAQQRLRCSQHCRILCPRILRTVSDPHWSAAWEGSLHCKLRKFPPRSTQPLSRLTDCTHAPERGGWGGATAALSEPTRRVGVHQPPPRRPLLGRIAWATTDLVNGETVIMRASEGKNAMRFRTMSPYPPSLFRHPLGNLQLCRILVRFWTATDARARGIFLFVVLVFFFWANWKYRTRRIVANDLRCQKESPRHFLICGLSLRQLSSFAHACAAQNPLRAEHADN